MDDCNDVKVGMRVLIGKLEPEAEAAMMINPKHLKVRREGATGTVIAYVPGHGGDVWWVEHDGTESQVGAYAYTEFESEPSGKEGK